MSSNILSNLNQTQAQAQPQQNTQLRAAHLNNPSGKTSNGSNIHSPRFPTYPMSHNQPHDFGETNTFSPQALQLNSQPHHHFPKHDKIINKPSSSMASPHLSKSQSPTVSLYNVANATLNPHPNPSATFTASMATPQLNQSHLLNHINSFNNAANHPPTVNLTDYQKFELHDKLKDQQRFNLKHSSSPSSSSISPAISTPFKVSKPQFAKTYGTSGIGGGRDTVVTTSNATALDIADTASINSIGTGKNNDRAGRISKKLTRSEMIQDQKTIPLDQYAPSDPTHDILQFTEEDIIILKNILSLAEIHKWKYISNKLSKIRSKKLNAEYCIRKFHLMYGLPFNPKNSLLNSNYFLKVDNGQNSEGENFEGMLGSSIPYIVSKNGWNLIDSD